MNPGFSIPCFYDFKQVSLCRLCVSQCQEEDNNQHLIEILYWESQCLYLY